MKQEDITNLFFQSGMRLLSQYLNFKCGEQEFKNPFLNGLQMGVASASTQDFFKLNNNKNQSNTDIAIQALTPLLFGCATTADDLLMSKGYTSKHYLTDIMSVFGTKNLLMEEKLLPGIEDKKLAYGISAGLLGIKYLQEYITGSKGYIETTRTLHTKLSKNIKNLEYVSDGLINIKSPVKAQLIFSEVINILNDLMHISQNDSINISQNDRKLEKEFMRMPLNYLHGMGNMIIPLVYAVNGGDIINNKNNKIINSPNSILKISSNDQISNTLNDIDRISKEVNQLNNDILIMNSQLINIQTFNNAFPILNLRSSFGEILNRSDTVEIRKQINDITSYMNKSKQSLISNPRTVIERSGLKYFVDKNQDMQHEMKYLEDTIARAQEGKIATIFMSFVDALITGYVTQDIMAAINTSTFALSICGLQKTEAFTPSLEKLTELYKFVENAQNTSYVNYHNYNGSNLQLKDIKIDINGVNKLSLDEMTLEGGKWYLLTGKSGCGKTTFMSTLRGLPNFADSIEIRGDAYYPKLSATDGSKIYMLTQTNNFPYMVPMIEAVLYPMVTTVAERHSYKPLVEEIMLKMEGFTRNSAEGKEYLEDGLLSRLNDRVNDITSETSGGQQKKMSITGMIVRIMKETGMLDIYNQEVEAGKSHDTAIAKAKNSVGSVLVLIDETFNGLDSGANGGTFGQSSKGLVLKTLKESLPSKAIVLSVEHQPQLDQYDARIHLNGDGSYQYTGGKSVMSIPTEYESFDPLQDIIGDIESL